MTDTHEKRERLVAGALLVAERDGQRALRASVKRATLDFASGLPDSGEAKRHELLVRYMSTLQDDAEDELSVLRSDAREGSRRAHKVALIALLLGGSRSAEAIDIRKRVTSAIESLARKTVPEDIVSARLAAQSVSAAWGKAATQAIAPGAGPYRTAGTRAGDEIALTVTRTVPAATEPIIKRVAVTEAATAHNAETKRIHDAMPLDVKAMIEMRWSAVLDSRTCQVCAGQDGKLIVSVYPPAHRQCRCVALAWKKTAAGKAAA